jgi:hypothetical protein
VAHLSHNSTATRAYGRRCPVLLSEDPTPQWANHVRVDRYEVRVDHVVNSRVPEPLSPLERQPDTFGSIFGFYLLWGASALLSASTAFSRDMSRTRPITRRATRAVMPLSAVVSAAQACC